MSAKRIGIVTIGQSPRRDLHDDFKTLVGPDVELLEIGALDHLDRSEIERLYPIADKSDILVSRMTDGSQITISEKDLEPLLQNAIKTMLSRQPDVLVVLCTGDLPDVESSTIPVILPKHVIQHFFLGLGTKKLAVMSPEPSQIENAKRRWNQAGIDCDNASGSPYLEQQPRYQGALKLANSDASIIYLDCMGYTLEQAGQIAKWSQKITLSARQIIFKAASSLILNQPEQSTQSQHNQ
ncbi:AroM family protein [Celerinatantimonas sp. MCCC 1A17872]|uniref:AroM family protein n=1 Tax=Celerinatantimonas sp. MCCC 1A17872 TaxID=3177514 RepID=UPI0038C15382